MALQGSLDSFAIADVLRLVASTRKSGCLRLDGDRGSGRVWLTDGAIVAGEATGAPRADRMAEVVHELLRFEDGEFWFDDTDTVEEPATPQTVDEVLDQASELAAEWSAIEEVVPGRRAVVRLRAEIDDDVTIDRATWRQLAALATAVTPQRLAEHLDLSELDATRVVVALVEQGLVELDGSEEPAEPPAATDVDVPAGTVEMAPFAADDFTFTPYLDPEAEAAPGDQAADAGVADSVFDPLAAEFGGISFDAPVAATEFEDLVGEDEGDASTGPQPEEYEPLTVIDEDSTAVDLDRGAGAEHQYLSLGAPEAGPLPEALPESLPAGPPESLPEALPESLPSAAGELVADDHDHDPAHHTHADADADHAEAEAEADHHEPVVESVAERTAAPVDAEAPPADATVAAAESADDADTERAVSPEPPPVPTVAEETSGDPFLHPAVARPQPDDEEAPPPPLAISVDESLDRPRASADGESSASAATRDAEEIAVHLGALSPKAAAAVAAAANALGSEDPDGSRSKRRKFSPARR